MPIRKINFGAIRAQLQFADVIAHYKVDGKDKGGDQWHGYCPLPSHVQKGEGGKPRSPSFSVNFARGIYQCFNCAGKGNVLEFVIRMEGFDPDSGEQFRQGAIRAEEIFLRGTTAKQPNVELAKPPADPSATVAPKEEESGLPIMVNAPLDFALQGLDAEHPYLKDRGFSVETIQHFGLGFAQRGMMKDRIAIPLKNPNGQLVGYAGRIIDDSAVGEDNPKYRFPGERERDGKKFVFRKSELLYHPDELRGCRSKYLFLVEGFPSVWWFWQNGIRATAAVMGASLSAHQVALVCALTTDDARIIVISDGDQAGTRLAESALVQLAPQRFVRWVPLTEGKQPTDWNHDELAALGKRFSS